MFSVNVPRSHDDRPQPGRRECSVRRSGCTARRMWSTRRSAARPSTHDGVVVDIGRAAEQLHAVLAELTYRNLDAETALAGINTTTEALARVIADRLADRCTPGPWRKRSGAGGAGPDVARVAHRVGELRTTTVKALLIPSSRTRRHR